MGLSLSTHTNTNLSYRTDTCPAPFRAAAGADGISLRTETHWPRALPAKHQFTLQNRYMLWLLVGDGKNSALGQAFVHKILYIFLKAYGIMH